MIKKHYKNITIVFAVVLFLIPIISCTKIIKKGDNGGNSSSGEYVSIHTVIFNKTIPVDIYALGDKAQTVIDEFLALADELDHSINVDVDLYESVLKKFNDSDKIDQWIEIDKHIYTMVDAVLQYYDIVQGYFNPSVAHLARLWNVDVEGMAEFNYNNWGLVYNPSMLDEIEQGFRLTPPYALVQSQLEEQALPDILSVKKDQDKFFAKKSTANLALDLGGIAKGYLADLGKELAYRYNLSSAAFNLSGDLYAFGYYHGASGQTNWNINITDPRNRKLEPKDVLFGKARDNIVATGISNTGLVTSGDYQRFWAYEGGESVVGDELLAMHIINPHTGNPAGIEVVDDYLYQNQTFAVSSASIIHPSSMIAEIVSTAVIASGMDVGIDIIKAVIAKDGDKVGAFVLEDAPDLIDNNARCVTLGSFVIDTKSQFDGYKRYNQVGILKH